MAALAHQPAVAAQVQAQKLRCRDEHAGEGRLELCPDMTPQAGHHDREATCNPGAFERDTLIKGTQRSEHSQPLLEAVSTTQTPQPGACPG